MGAEIEPDDVVQCDSVDLREREIEAEAQPGDEGFLLVEIDA